MKEIIVFEIMLAIFSVIEGRNSGLKYPLTIFLLANIVLWSAMGLAYLLFNLTFNKFI
jgi:hypothetical protein